MIVFTKILKVVFLFIVFQSKINGQTHQLNHQKYWYYRYRLINHFTKIGTEPGESLIFSIRGDDAPFYNGDHTNMLMGDQTITMGQYMAVLALEYNMLAQNNQNVDQTVKELWHLLYAFNRLDLNAESMYRPGVDGGIYTGTTPESLDLNGFFARDDCPDNFLEMNEAHFKSDVVYSKASQYIDSVNTDWEFSEDYYLDTMAIFKREFKDSLFSDVYQSDKNNAYNHSWRAIEMSFDQVYRIVFGLATIKKMIPDNLTYNGQSFQDGETGIQEEAIQILNRVMSQCRGDNDPAASAICTVGPWTLFNPIRHAPVLKGPISGYSWALAEAGNSMRFFFYDARPRYYVGVPYFGPLYHTYPSALLMYYSWKGAALALNGSNENDNRHMYSILGALIGVENGWEPFQGAYFDNYYPAEHVPMVRNVLHGGNGNPYEDSYYMDLLNSAPCIGPYKWNWPNDAAPYDWSTQDRLGHPERRGSGTVTPTKTNGESRAGEYAGVDYMLYHNLYYTIHNTDYPTPTNLMDNYVTLNFPFVIPIANDIGTYTNPVEIDMFNTLTASNTIRGDETNYLSNNESGKVTYRAGQQVVLQPGFHAEVGSDFHAYVQKFECAADGSYHANSTITNENAGKDSLYGMNNTNFNFHEEKQRTEYNYYYYDDRDPGKSGYGIVKEYDQVLTDTADFAAYLSNFADVTPNPTKGVTRISVPEQIFDAGNFTVSIHNLAGELLYEKEYRETNQFELDFSPFAKGMYIVNIFLEDTQIKLTKKVVRE